MKKHERSKTKTNGPVNSWRLFGGLFLSVLLLFTVIATAADTGTGESSAEATTSSAGAIATATGDTATVSTQVVTSGDGASSSGTAEAIASDGATATATVEVWASYANIASAYASAIATAIAGIGETVHAYAQADVSVSSDGTATASACTSAGSGDNNCISANDGNNGGEDGKIVPVKTPKQMAISGFIFGKSDLERYCTYKLQLKDGNSENHNRAEYYLNIIAWDYGFAQRQGFETKYNITDGTCAELVSYISPDAQIK